MRLFLLLFCSLLAFSCGCRPSSEVKESRFYEEGLTDGKLWADLDAKVGQLSATSRDVRLMRAVSEDSSKPKKGTADYREYERGFNKGYALVVKEARDHNDVLKPLEEK
jgi:hypothetical protein